MPGDFRCDRGDYARMLILFCMRGCGCIGHPAFPAPSEFQKAGRSWQTSRETCGEIAKLCLTSLRGAPATKQSSFLPGAKMDCFACARNDGLRIGCLKIESEKCDRRRCATLSIVITREGA